MNLFFFTNEYPYGMGETFIENEIVFLSKAFDTVNIIPLEATTNTHKRVVPDNVNVLEPLLTFSTKDRKRLLLNGLFNFSPLGFALKEFFAKRVYSKRKWIWNFFTSLLLFRTLNTTNKTIKILNERVNKSDVFYFYWADKSTLLLPKLKKSFQNKTFVRFHGTDIYEYANSGYIPFRQYVFPNIDVFVPISDNGREYLLDNYPNLVSNKKIKLSRLGVLDNGTNDILVEEDRAFHIVSCSGLSAVKRVELILDALMLVNEKIIWTHIGDGILMEKLKEKAKLLPQNVVVEWKGQMSNQEVLEYYKKSPIDLFLNVSSSEGVPVSIMEAISFGIPVVATNVGGTSEIVHSNNGVLLSKEILPTELSNQIIHFLKEEQFVFRQNAFSTWQKKYDANKNFSSFVELLTESHDE